MHRSGTDRRVLCVFVPGLKGSVLECDTCERRSWPPRFLDKNLELIRRCVSKRSLQVERLMDADESTCLVSHDHRVNGVLMELSLLNGLYKRDVYASFLNNLQRECDEIKSTTAGDDRKRVTLYKFAYDWTRGVRYAAEKLYSYLSDAAGGYDAVALIAHSMGGLVCRYMLEELIHNRRTSDASASELYRVVRLVYAMGVPHYGSIRSLYYLVDPGAKEFTRQCRKVQSLYDMIPYSDLKLQIEGLSALDGQNDEPFGFEAGLNKRYRSDMFLKTSDGVITVDRDHWEPNGRMVREDGRNYGAERIPLLVDSLIKRFPDLTEYADRLRRGAEVHFALNHSKRPSRCVYIFVNAAGFKSPSMIDIYDRLFRECEIGDGTVCSVVETTEKSRRRLKRASSVPTRKGGIDNEAGHDLDNRYNVHTKMLPYIDVFRAVREILAGELFGNGTIACNDGMRCLWRNFVNDQKRGEIVSISSNTFRNWKITVSNLSSGFCAVSVKPDETSDDSTGDECDMDIGLLPSIPNNRCKTFNVSSVRLPIEELAHVQIKVSINWKRLAIVLNGHYTLFSVRTIDSDVAAL